MNADDNAASLFFDLFSDLPRQGPGDAESTRRAFSSIGSQSRGARILDIGCGTGAQTLELARLSPATIVAVDSHPPFVEQLRRTSVRLGLASRVRGVVGDMRALGFAPRRFDILWCEGAIYNIGFDTALEAWRPLLCEHGHVAVSELCWLRSERAAECVRWLTGEYPAVRDVAANRRAIEAAGYELVADFLLPSSAWWRDYYDPLERRLPAFRARHRDDDTAAAIADGTEREIEMFRRYSDDYGYVFFVMRRAAGDRRATMR